MALAIVTLADEILAMVAPPGLMEAFVTECLQLFAKPARKGSVWVTGPIASRRKLLPPALLLRRDATFFRCQRLSVYIPPHGLPSENEPTVYSFANLERDKTTVWDA